MGLVYGCFGFDAVGFAGECCLVGLFGWVSLCDCCDGGFRVCVFVLVVVLVGFSFCFWFTLVVFGGCGMY